MKSVAHVAAWFFDTFRYEYIHMSATFSTHFAFTGSTMIRALPYPWNRRDARLCERDHLYLSSVSLLTYERSSHPRIRRFNRSGFVIGSRLHFSAPIRRRTFDDRTHVRDVCIFTSNSECIAASVARLQYLGNVFDWTLCHVARPSQRVIVVLYCVVLCVINRFPARSRSAFPNVATWKSLSNVGGRVINRNGEARFVPPVPPLFLVLLVYCVTSWIYPMQSRLNNFEVPS